MEFKGIGREAVNSMNLAQVRGQLRAVVNKTMNIQIP
jgi:hypothetical protein